MKSLSYFCSKPGFLQDYNSWKQRQVPSNGLMSDIGRVWQNLQEVNDEPYLSVANYLCLALNVDWFNSYKQTPYSAGALYLSILNLPRAKRFNKAHNILLVGMIPRPHEPSNLNPLLEPLVKDLQHFYEGIYVTVQSKQVKIRAILTCITCDLPATRKICGFANFNALKGCSKCLKSFPTSQFGAKPD